MIYNFGAAILRAIGDTKRPFIFLSISGLINFLLNLFLVIVLHLDVSGVAIATISRLSYIYNTEVRGRKFVGKNGQNIDSYDALLYKWMGRNNELNNHTATPLQNIYIQNVKKYANNYNMYSIRN